MRLKWLMGRLRIAQFFGSRFPLLSIYVGLKWPKFRPVNVSGLGLITRDLLFFVSGIGSIRACTCLSGAAT
jgi:hypothetical protein